MEVKNEIVLMEIKRLNSDVHDIQNELKQIHSLLTDVKVGMAMMQTEVKFKSGFFGAVFGLIPFFLYYLKEKFK